ncbi:MAG: hypothetical protein KatS3mg027_1788 [Bacteroidia bacterium]|nr:MAG: hypothetical protein KatS3mg027_1788 [Bacteroidia bacterium]
MRKIQNVDEYLLKGCGRCEKFDTEKCKVKIWNKEIRLLRDILLQTKLKEELKWSQPCYTFNGKNVCLLAVFKSYCAVSFFKGALINDVFQVLEKPGEHSHQVRMMKFVNVEQIMDRKEILLNYIQQAIELEEKGSSI